MAFLAIVAATSCLYWLSTAVRFEQLRCNLRRLSDLSAPDPSRWPRVTLVVPACNEAETLGPAVESRLAGDYPDLEVLIVDDRSTDATGAVADRLAAADRRVRAIHLRELPAGWLGKQNALERGARATSGEWLLFSDADVHFEKGTLRRAVAWAEAERLDILAVLPGVVSRSPLLALLVGGMVRSIVLYLRLWAIENPSSKAFLGVGAFNLVRRETWERFGGFEWLRLEPADDVGLGLLFKRMGATCGAAAGHGLVTVEWYPSVRAAAVGAERASFSACDYRLSLSLLLAAGMLVSELGVLAGLFPLGVPGLQVACAATVAVAVASAARTSLWAGVSPAGAPFLFAGSLLQIGVFLRAALLGAFRGGIVWRGTLYRSKELREGRRVRPFGSFRGPLPRPVAERRPNRP